MQHTESHQESHPVSRPAETRRSRGAKRLRGSSAPSAELIGEVHSFVAEATTHVTRTPPESIGSPADQTHALGRRCRHV